MSVEEDETPNYLGPPGTSIVTEVKMPDPDIKEADGKEEDAYFPTFGSILIFGAKPALEALLVEHKKKLGRYNAKLTKTKVPLRIRLTHSVKVRGKRYVYCGRYVYRKVPGGKTEYVGKLDQAEMRNDMQEKWKEVGPPPSNPLEGLKYQIVVANKAETDHIIFPYELYNDPRFNHIVSKFTTLRLA